MANRRQRQLSEGRAAAGVVSHKERRLANAPVRTKQQSSRAAGPSRLHLLGDLHAPLPSSRRRQDPLAERQQLRRTGDPSGGAQAARRGAGGNKGTQQETVGREKGDGPALPQAQERHDGEGRDREATPTL